MRIRFLGTGGTEGIPAIGCECRTCTRAWEQQGRHLRGCPAILFSLTGYELLIDTRQTFGASSTNFILTK